MSTVPLGRTTYPLLRRSVDVIGGSCERPLRRLIGHLQADQRNIPRYVLRYSVVALALLGLVSLWEAHGDGRIPMLFPLRSIDPGHVSSRHCAAKGVSEAVRWQGLAPALAILDQVDPPVADWVRQRHVEGAILFSDDYSGKRDKVGSYAKYDHFPGRLIVHRALFEEKDGTVAAILCHEYRHSRQNLAKVVTYALSFVFAKDGDSSIVENDAVLYERQATVAIFGRDASSD